MVAGMSAERFVESRLLSVLRRRRVVFSFGEMRRRVT